MVSPLQWYYGVQLKQGKQPCSDSSIKRIINLLHVLYLGLHSSQITKRLNSYPMHITSTLLTAIMTSEWTPHQNRLSINGQSVDSALKCLKLSTQS